MKEDSMQKRMLFIIIGIMISLTLVACGNDTDNESDSNLNEATNELKSLDVDFPLQETADVDEEVTLEASVTYGDEAVEDADEVVFEYWLKGDKDNSTKIESDNNEDGTYTQTVTFEEEGIYEIYAHTTAREMHTMPKKAINVGDVEADVDEDD